MCLLCDCTKEYDHGDKKKQRNHIMEKKLQNVGVMMTLDRFNGCWLRLLGMIDYDKLKQMFRGSIISETYFKEDYYPLIVDYEILGLAVMRLLLKDVYSIKSNYIKFTIGYIMVTPVGDISYTIGNAIPLFNLNKKLINKINIFKMIYEKIVLTGEKYKTSLIKCVFIRVYYIHNETIKEIKLNNDISNNDIREIIIKVLDSTVSYSETPEMLSLINVKKKYSKFVKAHKQKQIELRPFIVADIETVLLDDIQTPYAAGFLVVNSGDDISLKIDYDIYTSFSEYHSLFISDFKERSERML